MTLKRHCSQSTVDKQWQCAIPPYKEELYSQHCRVVLFFLGCQPCPVKTHSMRRMIMINNVELCKSVTQTNMNEGCGSQLRCSNEGAAWSCTVAARGWIAESEVTFSTAQHKSITARCLQMPGSHWVGSVCAFVCVYVCMCPCGRGVGGWGWMHDELCICAWKRTPLPLHWSLPKVLQICY